MQMNDNKCAGIPSWGCAIAIVLVINFTILIRKLNGRHAAGQHKVCVHCRFECVTDTSIVITSVTFVIMYVISSCMVTLLCCVIDTSLKL